MILILGIKTADINASKSNVRVDIFCTISFNSSWFLQSDAYLFLIAKKAELKLARLITKRCFKPVFKKPSEQFAVLTY